MTFDTTKTILAFLATGGLLAGCDVSGPTYVPTSKATMSADQAMDECRYEARLATANTAATPPSGPGLTNAVGRGVAEGIEDAELIKSCMTARGFVQQR